MIKFGDTYFNLNAVSNLTIRQYGRFPDTYCIELRLLDGSRLILGENYDNLEDARKDLDIFVKELVNETELKSRGTK